MGETFVCDDAPPSALRRRPGHLLFTLPQQLPASLSLRGLPLSLAHPPRAGALTTRPRCGGTQDGNEVFFKIKRSTQLKKLMGAYCDRQSQSLESIAFLFDGKRLRPEQTPDEVRKP